MGILPARRFEATEAAAARPSAARSPLASEQGAIAIIVAASLTMLFGIAALAIDLTLIYNWRRADQIGADHASLAAAWSWCQGEDPATAALLSASGNGFNNDGSSNTVSVTDLGGGRFEVTITSSVDELFAGVLGVDSLQTEARAVAGCTVEASGAYALFAGSTTCDKAIDWSGSNNDVTGAIHSNNGILVGGSNNQVEGVTTYLDEISVNETNEFSPEPFLVTEVLPYPADFQIIDYQPGGSRATLAGAQYYYSTGDINLGWLENHDPPLYNSTTGALATGLYFAEGNIDLSASNLHGTVTLVSRSGRITLSGSSQNLLAWDPDDLLMFSDWEPPSPCTDTVINVNGSGSLWQGTVYGPRGLVEMPGSDNSTIEGSLIGLTIRLNGSNLILNAPEDTGDEGPPPVSLLE